MNNQVDNSTIKETLSCFYDRNKSPFVITYIITWAVYNWQLWYVTFFVSENKLKFTKLQFIYNHFKHWEVVIYPLGYSLIALLIFAIFNSGFDYILSEFEILLNKGKQKRDPKKFVLKTDFNTLISKVHSLEKVNGENTLGKIELEREIGQLKIELEQRNSTNRRLIEENKNLTLSSIRFLPYELWRMEIYDDRSGVIPKFIFDFQILDNGFKIMSLDRKVNFSFNIDLMKYQKNESIYLLANAEKGVPIFIRMNIYIKKETLNEEIKGSIMVLDSENNLYDTNRPIFRDFKMIPVVNK